MNWKKPELRSPIFNTQDAESKRPLIDRNLKPGDMVKLIHPVQSQAEDVIVLVDVYQVVGNDQYKGTIRGFEPRQTHFLLVDHEGLRAQSEVEFHYSDVESVHQVRT